MTDFAAHKEALTLDICDAYLARCAKHGTQPFNSPAEMLGVLVEELHEVIEAIRANDPAAIDREVMDLMLPCLHWLARRSPPMTAATARGACATP